MSTLFDKQCELSWVFAIFIIFIPINKLEQQGLYAKKYIWGCRPIEQEDKGIGQCKNIFFFENSYKEFVP